MNAALKLAMADMKAVNVLVGDILIVAVKVLQTVYQYQKVMAVQDVIVIAENVYIVIFMIAKNIN